MTFLADNCLSRLQGFATTDTNETQASLPQLLLDDFGKRVVATVRQQGDFQSMFAIIVNYNHDKKVSFMRHFHATGR